jgi:serine/threonine protein kinase/tetratricopeptide (TPR) repeat protein
MISEPSEILTQSAATDRELAEVLDRYLVSLEENAPLDVEKLVAEYPRLAADIRAFVASVDMLHGATREIGEASREAVVTPPEPEKRLGDFEIGPEIGRGGMGVVYEARQISLQRKVALKVLPFAAMWDHKQIARFQNEAQAAAQLHHPNIVPVFAVGQERGVHFYAMQLIQGRSLDAVLMELRRDLSDRPEQAQISTQVHQSTAQSMLSSEMLSSGWAAGQSQYCRAIATLGIQAANALQYAHECGVVHRDIKPSNLLLDGHNKLWITDFGLARLQDSPGVTGTGDVVGTLRYMSPEQASSQHALVDPRTDIYALGATLYELLTLRPAFPGEDRQAVLQAIINSEPTAPRSLNPEVPLDLETIVLQAMAKIREDRYSSAGQLADDLNRFLEGKPTLARRPTVADRASKWVRRHRTVVTLAGVFLAVLAVVSTTGAILLSREHSRKQAALDVAEANLQQAREVVDRFGLQFSHELARLPGSEPLRLAVLSDTLKYYQEFIARSAGDPTLRSDLAATHFHAGTIASQLGERETAEKSFRAAAELFAELATPGSDRTNSDSAKFRQQQATALNNLALLYVADGKLKEASEQYADAIRLQSTVANAESSDPQAKQLLAELYTNRGLLERQQGEPAAARKSLTKAIGVLEQVIDTKPQDRDARHALAMALNNRSFVEQQSDWLSARKSCQAAVEILEELMETASEGTSTASTRSDLSLSYNNLAAILGHLGEEAEAVEAFERAIEIQERLVRQAPGVVQYRSDLAITWNNLAQSLARAEEHDRAELAYQRAEELFAELVDDFPSDVRYRSSLAGVFNNRGMAYELQGDLKEALSVYKQAIENQQVAVSRSPGQSQYREYLSKHYVNCSRVLQLLDRPADAVAITLARRDLWQGQGEMLFQVGLELATIVSENSEKSAAELDGQAVLDEAVTTLEQARAAGREIRATELPPVLKTHYDVVSKFTGESVP